MRAQSTGIVIAAVAIVLVASPLRAQQDDPFRRAVLAPTIDDLKKQRASPDKQDYPDAIDQALLADKYVLAASSSTANGRFIAEANRLDKQVGASGRGTGTTNLVSSGSVPRLLGFAMETGAITQTVSGTSITFQTNPAGLAQALTRGVQALDVPLDDQASRNTLTFLGRVNVGLTFDAAKDKEQTFTGSYQELQQFSTQIYLHNHRDPTHPSWASLWTEFAQRAGSALPNAARDLAVSLAAQPGYRALVDQTRKRLLAATTDAHVEEAIFAHASAVAPLVSAEVSARLLDAWASYLRTQTQAYADVARSQILTFEYQFDRPPAQDASADTAAQPAAAEAPDLSTFRLIWVRPFLGPSDMTVTASVSTFNQDEMPVRDWQIGGKLDFPLKGVVGFTKSQLTFAGLYMNLKRSPLGIPVIVNGVEVDRTGGLGFFQARLKVPMGDSGVSVPLSVTFASRTELVKDEGEIRGNVGFTFDLDKLIGRN